MRLPIPIVVTAIHIALLAPLLVKRERPLPPPKPTQLIVRTVEPLPPPPPTPAPTPPKKRPKPTPAPVKKPTKPAKKSTPSKKPSKQNRKRREKLRQVQETIAKIGQSTDKSSSTSLHKAVPKLRVDRLDKRLSGGEQRYCDELAQRLRLLLRLPEFGEIKLLLTIDRSGAVCQVEVVRSLSRKNRDYVVEKLSATRLPGFGALFPDQDKETFPITLSSEM